MVKKVYPYERNSQKEWKTYIFLVKVHLFYYFEIEKIAQKVYPYEKNSQKEWKKHTFSSEGYTFLTILKLEK